MGWVLSVFCPCGTAVLYGIHNPTVRAIISCFAAHRLPFQGLSSRRDRHASRGNNGTLMGALFAQPAGSCTVALVAVLENTERRILLCRLHRCPCCAKPHMPPAVIIITSRYRTLVGLKSEPRSLPSFPRVCRFRWCLQGFYLCLQKWPGPSIYSALVSVFRNPDICMIHSSNAECRCLRPGHAGTICHLPMLVPGSSAVAGGQFSNCMRAHSS